MAVIASEDNRFAEHNGFDLVEIKKAMKENETRKRKRGASTNIPQTADLEKACRKAFGKPPLLVFELGGVVSANTGPDTVALVYTGHPRG